MKIKKWAICFSLKHGIALGDARVNQTFYRDDLKLVEQFENKKNRFIKIKQTKEEDFYENVIIIPRENILFVNYWDYKKHGE